MPAIYYSDNNCFLQSAFQTWFNCQEVVNIFLPRILDTNFILKSSGFCAPYSIYEIRIFAEDNLKTLKELFKKKDNDDFSELSAQISTMLAKKNEIATPYNEQIEMAKQKGTTGGQETDESRQLAADLVNDTQYQIVKNQLKALENIRDEKRKIWQELFTDVICSFFATCLEVQANIDTAKLVSINGIHYMYDVMKKFSPDLAVEDIGSKSNFGEKESYGACITNILNFIIPEISSQIKSLFGDGFPLQIYRRCLGCLYAEPYDRNPEFENNCFIQLRANKSSKGNVSTLGELLQDKFSASSTHDGLDLTNCRRENCSNRSIGHFYYKKPIISSSEQLLCFEVTTSSEGFSHKIEKSPMLISYQAKVQFANFSNEIMIYDLVSLVIFVNNNHYENLISIKSLTQWLLKYPNNNEMPFLDRKKDSYRIMSAIYRPHKEHTEKVLTKDCNFNSVDPSIKKCKDAIQIKFDKLLLPNVKKQTKKKEEELRLEMLSWQEILELLDRNDSNTQFYLPLICNLLVIDCELFIPEAELPNNRDFMDEINSKNR